jgi:hypothetical protein
MKRPATLCASRARHPQTRATVGASNPGGAFHMRGTIRRRSIGWLPFLVSREDEAPVVEAMFGKRLGIYAELEVGRIDRVRFQRFDANAPKSRAPSQHSAGKEDRSACEDDFGFRHIGLLSLKGLTARRTDGASLHGRNLRWICPAGCAGRHKLSDCVLSPPPPRGTDDQGRPCARDGLHRCPASAVRSARTASHGAAAQSRAVMSGL